MMGFLSSRYVRLPGGSMKKILSWFHGQHQRRKKLRINHYN